MPVELIAVDRGTGSFWRVRSARPAARGQRRAAVRAPLPVPVRVDHDGVRLAGVTVDLSEGGLRSLVDPVGPEPTRRAASRAPLETGDVVTVHLPFDRGVVDGGAEVVRRHRRSDDHIELSLRFLGIPERDRDLIRRSVFACLRDLRARGVL